MDYDERQNAVRERVNALLKEKGITQNQVAAGNTPAQKRINGQLSHGSGITLDTLLRVMDACPDVSLDWLLRGTGDMYVNGSSAITGANKVTGSRATVIGQQVGTLSQDFVTSLLAEKDKQINLLLTLLQK